MDIEGFKAAILMPDFMFKVDEAHEAFHLLQRDGKFRYGDYLIENNQFLKPIVLGSIRAYSQNSFKTDTNQGMLHSLTHL